MEEPQQLTIDGEEKPHREVVAEQKPPKRRTVKLADIEFIASIIRDADHLSERDRVNLAVSFGIALQPMNARFSYEHFLSMCGCGE